MATERQDPRPWVVKRTSRCESSSSYPTATGGAHGAGFELVSVRAVRTANGSAKDRNTAAILISIQRPFSKSYCWAGAHHGGVALDLVLLGPPGSGKGTQAALLSEKYGIPAISTGDVLRAQVEAGIPLGKRVKAYLDRGELVPDSLVVDLIQHRLLDPDTQQGFILDGFPRTLPQAQALDTMLAALDRPLDAVLYLQVDPQAVRERLGQRHRGDDRQSVIDHRLDVFLDQTAPLITYYQEEGKLKLIDGSQPPEVVAASIEDAIRSLAESGNGSSRTPSRS